MRLVQQGGSAEATEWSREVMRTQYEWLFINMTVANKTVNSFVSDQDMIIYTVSWAQTCFKLYLFARMHFV